MPPLLLLAAFAPFPSKKRRTRHRRFRPMRDRVHPVDQLPDLSDTRTAFAAKSDRDLWQAYWLFRIIGDPVLTKVGSTLSKVALALHLPVKGAIKATIFKQFCGGETVEESL